jgi:hypothetical protein
VTSAREPLFADMRGIETAARHDRQSIRMRRILRDLTVSSPRSRPGQAAPFITVRNCVDAVDMLCSRAIGWTIPSRTEHQAAEARSRDRQKIVQPGWAKSHTVLDAGIDK